MRRILVGSTFFISVRYFTLPTIEEVFPLPALLTTRQLFSSETIALLCCSSNGYFKQLSKKSLLSESVLFVTVSLCLATASWMLLKSSTNLVILSVGVT